MNRGFRIAAALGVGMAFTWMLSTTLGSWALGYQHVHGCISLPNGGLCAVASRLAVGLLIAGFIVLPLAAVALAWFIHRWLISASLARPSRPEGLALTCVCLAALSFLGVLGFILALTWSTPTAIGAWSVLLALAFGWAALALWRAMPAGRMVALTALVVSILVSVASMVIWPSPWFLNSVALIAVKLAMAWYLMRAGARARAMVT